MDIQIWSDVICPWCYLGKSRLEKALAGFPGEVTVTFRAFQLDPIARARTHCRSSRPWPPSSAARSGPSRCSPT